MGIIPHRNAYLGVVQSIHQLLVVLPSQVYHGIVEVQRVVIVVVDNHIGAGGIAATAEYNGCHTHFRRQELLLFRPRMPPSRPITPLVKPPTSVPNNASNVSAERVP